METIRNQIEPGQTAECEALLCKLPGVLGAKIVLDDGGTVTELHMLASRARTPKQLARDVQSAMLAGYGCDLDHRVISIAQVAMETPFSGECPRLVCAGVTCSVSEGRCSAQVTLRAGDQNYVGESQGSSLPFSRNQMVAAAAIEAVHAFMGCRNLFTVVDVRQTPVADRQAVLVAVGLQNSLGGEMLLGAVCDQSDLNQAIVKAALDAVNRRLARLRL